MNILIVTYTYPPSKSVNGYRPYYFARALSRNKWNVQILTRHFTGNEDFAKLDAANDTPFSISLEEGILIKRVPHNNSWFSYFRIVKNFPGLWKFIYFIQLLFGRTCQESYNKWFKPYLKSILKAERIDLILVESGPTNLVRIVSKMASYFQIPFLIDFRDAFYHEMYLKDQSGLPIGKRLKIGVEKFYMNSSIQGAKYCISLSSELLDILNIPADKRKIIVNGFDESRWSGVSTVSNNNLFRITVGGRLYNYKFADEFLDTLHRFLKLEFAQVELLFIAPGPHEIINKIHRHLPFSNVRIIENRIPYEDTIRHFSQSQVLAYHGWKGYRAYASAKIYDYIRAGKKIWIYPSDHDIVDKLLAETKTGGSFTSAEEALNQLITWYKEWEQNGGIVVDSDKVNISKYSRITQSEKIVPICEAAWVG